MRGVGIMIINIESSLGKQNYKNHTIDNRVQPLSDLDPAEYIILGYQPWLGISISGPLSDDPVHSLAFIVQYIIRDLPFSCLILPISLNSLTIF